MINSNIDTEIRHLKNYYLYSQINSKILSINSTILIPIHVEYITKGNFNNI